MKTAIQKIAKKYRPIKDIRYIDGLVINPDGKVYELLHGLIHDDFCELAGTCLADYIDAGGIRLKIYNEVLAIEYIGKPTDNQVIKLREIVRANDISQLIIDNGKDQTIVFEYDGIKQRHLLQVIEG